VAAKLHALAKQTEPEIIRYLEELLARAHAGELTGIAVLAQDGQGVDYHTAGLKDRYTQSGFLFHLMYRLQSDA
jgi:hypothetical protein